jgi:hypothetical protein
VSGDADWRVELSPHYSIATFRVKGAILRHCRPTTSLLPVSTVQIVAEPPRADTKKPNVSVGLICYPGYFTVRPTGPRAAKVARAPSRTIGAGIVSERAFYGISALLFAASTAVTVVWCSSISARGRVASDRASNGVRMTRPHREPERRPPCCTWDISSGSHPPKRRTGTRLPLSGLVFTHLQVGRETNRAWTGYSEVIPL